MFKATIVFSKSEHKRKRIAQMYTDFRRARSDENLSERRGEVASRFKPREFKAHRT